MRPKDTLHQGVYVWQQTKSRIRLPVVDHQGLCDRQGLERFCIEMPSGRREIRKFYLIARKETFENNVMPQIQRLNRLVLVSPLMSRIPNAFE
jgi:hypothetical protein